MGVGEPVIELIRSHAVVTLARTPDDIKTGGLTLDRFRIILEESKLYGMILAISAIVWIAGFWARTEQRWHETGWLAPPNHLQPDGLAGIDLNDPADDAAVE